MVNWACAFGGNVWVSQALHVTAPAGATLANPPMPPSHPFGGNMGMAMVAMANGDGSITPLSWTVGDYPWVTTPTQVPFVVGEGGLDVVLVLAGRVYTDPCSADNPAPGVTWDWPDVLSDQFATEPSDWVPSQDQALAPYYSAETGTWSQLPPNPDVPDPVPDPVPVRASLRHRQRHVHETIVRYVADQLDDLGWITPPINFGATRVNVMSYEPQQAGETPPLNTVAVSIGAQGSDDPYELGGGMACDYTLFVDVYGENEPVGIAIAEDVKQMLVDRYLPLLDFTTSAQGVPTSDLLEMETVIVDVLPTTGSMDKRTWRAVKATARCYF